MKNNISKRNNKLLNDTAIFLFGNIGSKIIQFFLVPLYTYTLSESEYGTADIILTTVNFLIPIFSIQITDALLRFGLDKKIKKEETLISAIRIASIGSLVLIVLALSLSAIEQIRNWALPAAAIIILMIFRDIFSINLKIHDKNKQFVYGSIIYTATLCISNIVLLVFFKKGVSGYLFSYVVASTISLIYLVSKSGLNINKIRRKADLVLMKKMALYSLPLIINSLAFWITTGSDRYMLQWTLGASAVGLYAVATKIPHIVTTFTGIFNQAWMLTSINEYENERSSIYYSKMLEKYIEISFTLNSVLILIMQPLMRVYVSDNYYISWTYADVLTLSAIFSSICAFLDGIFYAYKKNIKVTITTIIGATLNIILNLIMIPKLGIMGASIATVISWLVIAFIRLIIIRNIVNINISYAKLSVQLFLIIMEILLIHMGNQIVAIIIPIIITASICIFNKNTIIQVATAVKNRIHSAIANKVRKA